MFCFDKKNNNNVWSYCDGLFICRLVDWLCNGEIVIFLEKDVIDYCFVFVELVIVWSFFIFYYKFLGLEKLLF